MPQRMVVVVYESIFLKLTITFKVDGNTIQTFSLFLQNKISLVLPLKSVASHQDHWYIH